MRLHSSVSWRAPFYAIVPLAVTLSLIPAPAALGQEVTEPSLKAAVIYNVAKFTEWPLDALAAEARFKACVVGDTPTGDVLESVLNGRTVAGHTIGVSHLPASAALHTCHLLYIAGIAPAQATRLAQALRGVPVLTIVDIDGFEAAGAITRLFVENGRLRFDLDYGSAKRARLRLSSKMLALASRVYDGPEAEPR